MLRLVLAVSLLASAPSCPDLYSLATHGFTQPALTNSGATAAPVASGVQFSMQLSATNPNAFDINLSGVDYTATVNGKSSFAGTEDGLTVPANGSANVTVSGVVPYSEFAQVKPGATVPYTIDGTAHFSSPAGVPVDVEFEVAGTVAIPGGVLNGLR